MDSIQAIETTFLAGGLVSSESVLYNHHTEQTI